MAQSRFDPSIFTFLQTLQATGAFGRDAVTPFLDAAVAALPLQGLLPCWVIGLSCRAWVATLPSSLKIEGTLDLQGCPGLLALPEGVEVAADFLVHGCDESLAP